MRIARLVEETDWRGVLPQIDEIFFATSAVQTFRDEQHRASFKLRWLGRYLEQFTNSFFIARDEDGRVAGFLAGCLDNPALSPVFNDTGIYRVFASLCPQYPCHLHVNVDTHFRNRRVGTALIEAFVAHARSYHAPGLHVITDKGPKLRFYERNGFRTLAMTRWSGVEVLFMARRLTMSRNAQCPCGSGKKFKHCHGAFAQSAPASDRVESSTWLREGVAQEREHGAAKLFSHSS
jgi:GNAT superfamily N-acetyltransferase